MEDRKSAKKTDELDIELQPEVKFDVGPLDRDLDKGSFISYSVWSKYGLGVFGIAVLIIFIIQILEIELFGNLERSSLFILILSFLVLFFCFIADLLRWKDFTEWGALGAIIAYLGIALIFTPIIIFIFNPIDELLSVIIITVGVIITIIGFASHATELDRKISDQFFIFIQWVKAGGIQKALFALGTLILTIMGGISRYLLNGVRNLPRMIGRFIRLISRSLKALSKGIWHNIHWVGLVGIFFILIISEYNFFINFELMIIVGFFFSLGVIYPRHDRVANLVNRTGNFVLNRVVSAYSMLTGTKLKVPEAMYCTRCLRGVERKEFVSLMEVKGTENPPCPFCGYSNWITIYQKPVYRETVFPDRPITEVIVKDTKTKHDEEIVTKDIEETLEIPTVEKETEVYEEVQKSQEIQFEPSEEVETDERPIFILRNNLIELGQRLAPNSKEFREWHNWFIKQTDLFAAGNIYEKTYRKMIQRYLDFLQSKGIDDLEFAGYTGIEITTDEEFSEEEVVQEESSITRELPVSETIVTVKPQEKQRDLEPTSPWKASRIVEPSRIVREMMFFPWVAMKVFWNSFTIYVLVSFSVCFFYGLLVPLIIPTFDRFFGFSFFIFNLGYLTHLFDQLSSNIIYQMVISSIIGTVIWSIVFIAILKPHFYGTGIGKYWTTIQEKLPETKGSKANLIPFLYVFVIILFIFSFILILVFVYLVPLIFLYFLPFRDVKVQKEAQIAQSGALTKESSEREKFNDNRCPSCGAVIKPELRNCPFCGTQIIGKSTMSKPVKTVLTTDLKQDEQKLSLSSENMHGKEEELDLRQLEVLEEIPLSTYVEIIQQLGQQLASIDEEINKWVEWFFQQTQLYQESQMKEVMYTTIIKRFQKVLLELDCDEMELKDLEILDEFLTLLHGILEGKILILKKINFEK